MGSLVVRSSADKARKCEKNCLTSKPATSRGQVGEIRERLGMLRGEWMRLSEYTSAEARPVALGRQRVNAARWDHEVSKNSHRKVNCRR